MDGYKRTRLRSASWAPNHARHYSAAPSALRQRRLRKLAAKRTCWRAKRRIIVCWVTRAQPSRRLRSATRSTPASAILNFEVLAATLIKPWRSTFCAARRRCQSMNWNATCGARIARRCAGILTNAATLSPFAAKNYRRCCHLRTRGRGSGR